MLSWDDPELVSVAGDNALRRRHRRLQSWYRESVLGVGPGRDLSGHLRGNMLAPDDVGQNPALNFLGRSDLAQVAEDRIAENVGTVDVDRLRRNLLSSQLLCVNLFGPLRFVDRHRVADALQPALHMDMTNISNPLIEWAPTPASSSWSPGARTERAGSPSAAFG